MTRRQDKAKGRRTAAAAVVAVHELHCAALRVREAQTVATNAGKLLLDNLREIPGGIPEQAKVPLVKARLELADGPLSLETLIELVDALPNYRWMPTDILHRTNRTAVRELIARIHGRDIGQA